MSEKSIKCGVSVFNNHTLSSSTVGGVRFRHRPILTWQSHLTNLMKERKYCIKRTSWVDLLVLDALKPFARFYLVLLCHGWCSFSRNRPLSGRRTFLQLPLSRVKSIMKSDPDVTLTGHDATFLIAKV